MYLRRLRLSEFLKPREDASTYPELPGAYKVCCASRSENPADAAIVDWVTALQNVDRGSFRSGMSTLLKVANEGRKFETHYDEKACHEAHRFSYKGQEYVVWRIRVGDLRILFHYAKDHIVLLSDAFAKHRDKLTKAQTGKAERDIKAFIDATELKYTRDKDHGQQKAHKD